MSPNACSLLLVLTAFPASAAEIQMAIPVPDAWRLEVVSGASPMLRLAECGAEDDRVAAPLRDGAWRAPEGTFCEVVLTWDEPLVLDLRGPGARSLDLASDVGEVHITLDEPVTLHRDDDPWIFALGNGSWLKPAEAWVSAGVHRTVDVERAARGNVTAALRAAAFGPLEDGLASGRTDSAWGITTR